jgi:hypothetical protein
MQISKPVLAQISKSDLAQTKKKEKKYCWVEISPAQPFLGLSLAQLAGPTQLIFYNNIILYNIRLGKIFKKKNLSKI